MRSRRRDASGCRQGAMATDHDALIEALPAYEISGEIGRGAFGVVVAARHRRLGNDVAIKQLAAGVVSDPDVRRRFVAEARFLATLDHPHIVRIHDFVETDDTCALIMERLTGGTVHYRMAGGDMTPQTACAIAVAAASGLHYAHQRGILHRDVKPQNLMFSATDVLKVADFGIAKMLEGSFTQATMQGSAMGTPDYMAPEQVLGRAVTPATDVYALGTLLYEMLSGQPTFPRGSDALAALYQHVHEDPQPLREVAPDVPAGIAAAVGKALALDAGDRYPTAADFGEAVSEASAAAWGPEWFAGTGLVLFESGTAGRGASGAQAPAETDAGPSMIGAEPSAAQSGARSHATIAAVPGIGTAPPPSGAATPGSPAPPASPHPSPWLSPKVLVPAVLILAAIVIGGGAFVLGRSSAPRALTAVPLVLTTSDLPAFTQAPVPVTPTTLVQNATSQAFVTFTSPDAHPLTLVDGAIVFANDAKAVTWVRGVPADIAAGQRVVSHPVIGTGATILDLGLSADGNERFELVWTEGRVGCRIQWEAPAGSPDTAIVLGFARKQDTRVRSALGLAPAA